MKADLRSMRWIGLFGKREIELAAMVLFDSGKMRGSVRKADVGSGAFEQRGFDLLVDYKWLLPSASIPGAYFATTAFIDRCNGAQAKDHAERA